MFRKINSSIPSFFKKPGLLSVKLRCPLGINSICVFFTDLQWNKNKVKSNRQNHAIFNTKVPRAANISDNNCTNLLIYGEMNNLDEFTARGCKPLQHQEYRYFYLWTR